MRADSWSILIRFSNLNTKGNFQLWNANFFNFYNGGYEILIQKKWWNMDRVDEESDLILSKNGVVHGVVDSVVYFFFGEV